MRTDGLFTQHFHTEYVNLNEPLFFCPVSDIHRDSDLHADREWQDWLDYAKRERKGALFLFLGDGLDFSRAHVRAMLDSNGNEGQNVKDRLTAACYESCDQLIGEVEPFKKRIVGWMSGNHYFEFTEKFRGETLKRHSDRYIANELGVEYLGVMCHITLTLRDRKTGLAADVKIIAHHGVGGGSTPAGQLNRVARMVKSWDADIGLMGDSHARGVVPLGSVIGSSRAESRAILTSRHQYVARTGSFVCGFEDGKSSYVVDAGYEPTSIGTIEIEMRLAKCPRTGKAIVKLRGIC